MQLVGCLKSENQLTLRGVVLRLTCSFTYHCNCVVLCPDFSAVHADLLVASLGGLASVLWLSCVRFHHRLCFMLPLQGSDRQFV